VSTRTGYVQAEGHSVQHKVQQESALRKKRPLTKKKNGKSNAHDVAFDPANNRTMQRSFGGGGGRQPATTDPNKVKGHDDDDSRLSTAAAAMVFLPTTTCFEVTVVPCDLDTPNEEGQ
jgi:hypothetical protein